ncbi:ClbS/DfsB family four-helix bundle protein [Schleiferilactobacillus perolens]|jgi:hypothetical protein|uniref:ClbS/DfsB family four-helix bundle protein n=1 Tax=Schleiferilactobacillus perolens TaxID=100468 RepID=UPI0023577058|nr:ClbS/DfsB family four-helix bundle protein [Schleiferilactobacillus perolens]MCI2171143.1 ClbS/DfsB family four-helix bundle protein [Schleiferilactobacillus perolens]
MQAYHDQQALIDAIQLTLNKFIAEFSDIPENERDLRLAGVERTPGEMLAYNVGWTALLLDWERQEKAGLAVQTPAPDYKWNNLGGLYQEFYAQYANENLAALQRHLIDNVAAITKWLATLSNTEFFDPGQRQWANNTAQWPLWKWVHINTVAPFRTFRTKIRKWKRVHKETFTD